MTAFNVPFDVITPFRNIDITLGFIEVQEIIYVVAFGFEQRLQVF